MAIRGQGGGDPFGQQAVAGGGEMPLVGKEQIALAAVAGVAQVGGAGVPR